MQQKNFLLFLVIAFLMFTLWMELTGRRRPPPKPVNPPVVKKTPEKEMDAGLKVALGPIAALPGAVPRPKPKTIPLPERPEVIPADRLPVLGSADPDSKFHLRFLLDPRGAGVRSAVLNKFAEASDLGTPVWKNREEHVPEPLELIPAAANRENPSNLLYLYDPHNPTDNRPLDTLGKRVWDVVKGNGQEVVKDETSDGRERHSLTFTTQLANGLKVFKKYTLVAGDYHVGLEVSFELAKDSAEREGLNLRYQLTGAHGLPIEGRWYTNVFRNALIAEVKDGLVYRDLQDLRQIDYWTGGNQVKRQQGRILRYAGVAVQYFASVIVVDENQPNQAFLEQARPTLETAVFRGAIKSVDEDGAEMVLIGPNGKEETFYPETPGLFKGLPPNRRVAVVYSTDNQQRAIASDVAPENSIQPLWQDDITVRVMTEPVRLKPGEALTHRYLLYNGPVKPSLLRQQTGDGQVPEAVIDRYVDKLKLNTLTDYHSPGWVGSFASSIYWTDLVIHCTNFMHWVLGGIHSLIPSYGLSIILLTVLVRGLMFPLSRKQAMMSIRMQAIMPEMKAIQERFKDDKQGQVQAQMELYRRYNINPFGTCWLLLLQMPIFMGLYFSLQESITFRLAPFWPTWIINLAAPDMLFYWGQKIPWISRPEDYGGFLYLGPYFNLLPVVAVALMLVQQKMMTPPPTDEQQEMQQKMMKWMMVFMGLMFYKVAAGLCLYFIASSLWGFTERKLLPKFKPQTGKVSADTALRDLMGRPAPAPSTAVTAGSSVAGVLDRSADDGRGRRGKAGRGRKRERGARVEEIVEEPKTPLGRVAAWFRAKRKKLSDWWTEVLKQAEKKG